MSCPSCPWLQDFLELRRIEQQASKQAGEIAELKAQQEQVGGFAGGNDVVLRWGRIGVPCATRM